MTSGNGFLHFRHGNGWQVFGEQHEHKEKQAKCAQHNPELDPSGRVKSPGMGGKTVGDPADDNYEAFPPHAEIDD